MSSAKEVEPDGPVAHDDRLSRAFDRAARLGIDVDPDDPISARESAAVRAFTALNLDVTEDVPAAGAEPANAAGHPVPADHSADHSADHGPDHSADDGADPVGPAGPGAPGPFRAPGVAGPTGAEAPASSPTVLRPDAVLRGRSLRSDGLVTVPPPGEVEADGPRTVPPTPRAAAPAATSPPTAGGGAPPGPGLRGPAAGDAPLVASAPASRPVGRFLLDLLAAALAAGAIVSPWGWLAVVATGALVAAAARSLADHGDGAGALVGRAVRRVAAWLRPRSVVRCVLAVVQAGLLAVVLPGLVCAVWWVTDQGVDGAFVAGRLGVWAHSLRVAAATLCFLLVAGAGDAHHRRAERVAQRAIRTGPARVTALAVITVVAAAGVVALVPRTDAGPLAAEDGLGWAPVRLRDNLDRLRDDVVIAELHAADGCLSDRHGLTWRASYTVGNAPGARDTASIRSGDGDPTPGQVATALAALHNQLAPWVEDIELWAGDVRLVVLDRASLPSGRPLVEASALERGATEGRALLEDAPGGVERATALACAAAPLP
jgi:hypothetical protein